MSTPSPDYVREGRAPRDDALPGLPILLDSARVAELLGPRLRRLGAIDGCAVTYVRYKPETNCIVTYNVRCVDRESGTDADPCHLRANEAASCLSWEGSIYGSSGDRAGPPHRRRDHRRNAPHRRVGHVRRCWFTGSSSA